jgi:Transposase
VATGGFRCGRASSGPAEARRRRRAGRCRRGSSRAAVRRSSRSRRGRCCSGPRPSRAALDECGRLLGDAAFATSVEGYRELLAWLESFGQVGRVGVESTGSYAAGLARFLAARGIAVVEVNQPHAHTQRRCGKSDPLGAEAAARKVLAGEATAIPKHSGGIVESIRQLRVAREGAVKANTAALNQLYELVITAPDELRQQLAGRKTSRGKAALCLRLRPDRARLHEPLQAAKLALRSIAERVRELDRQIRLLDRHLAQLVATAAPRTTSLPGRLHPARRPAPHHRRPEHRAAHQRRCLRPPLRRQPDPRLLGTHQQTPAQPRRRPQGQPRTPPDRRLPTPLLRSHPRLRQPSSRRRPDQTRDHPLPQALHRPRALPHPPRRPFRPRTVDDADTANAHDQLRRKTDRHHPHQETPPHSHSTSIGTSASAAYLTRWEKRADTYLAMLHLACAPDHLARNQLGAPIEIGT